MINKMDVVTMRLPFPTVSSDLAVNSHMYICIKDGITKEFIKCQTFKPMHKVRTKPPYRYIQEKADPARNPFQRTTTIDCDKAFSISSVKISRDLLATNNRSNICDDLFNEIALKIQFPNFIKEHLHPSSITRLNRKISIILSQQDSEDVAN